MTQAQAEQLIKEFAGKYINFVLKVDQDKYFIIDGCPEKYNETDRTITIGYENETKIFIPWNDVIFYSVGPVPDFQIRKISK